MSREIRRLFEEVARRGHDRRLEGVRGRYRFDIEGVGSWLVTIDDGALTVEETRGDAECIISSDAADALRIARGEQNLLTAFLQGRVDVDGDLTLAQKFQGLLPSPDARSPRPENAS
jgi:predicted lipid carrier protein YhbT